MVAAFGTGGARGKRKWQNRQFLENHAVLRAGGLRGSTVTITLNGHAQVVVQLEQEWTFGRKQRQRPWFKCPECYRRCRLLHERSGTFVCRLCSPEYDYRSRHRNRSCPALNRVRRVAGLPHRAYARERVIAQAEIARSLRAMVQDLQRRARRGKR